MRNQGRGRERGRGRAAAIARFEADGQTGRGATREEEPEEDDEEDAGWPERTCRVGDRRSGGYLRAANGRMLGEDGGSKMEDGGGWQTVRARCTD